MVVLLLYINPLFLLKFWAILNFVNFDRWKNKKNKLPIKLKTQRFLH